MMNCPGCQKEMGWIGDSDHEEDIYSTMMCCRECEIEVVKYWGEGIDRLKEQGETYL